MTKVLHIIWGFAGGGVDKVVEAYARMPQHVAVDARFVCMHGEGWGTDIAALEEMGAHRITFRNRRDLSWIGRLAAHIDAIAPDVLFAHGFNAPVAATAALRRAQCSPPLACSYHGSYHAPTALRKPLEPVFNGALHWLYRRRAAGVVSVAEHSQKYLLARGVDAARVTTIHNGLPPRPHHAHSPKRSDFGLTEQDFIIGAASRLAPEKGLLHLLEAMPRIVDHVPAARLLILGQGPQKDQLVAHVRDKGLQERVIFAGFRADADAFLDLYDVFALPSLAEYHSIALLEAMRAALPIVATTVGGNPESVCDGQEALMVPPAEPAALAEALIRMATDPLLAARLAKGARARFEAEFSETVMLTRTHDWLAGLAGSA